MVKQSIDYQKLSDELDNIITILQSNDVPIDEAIKLHGRGEEIIKQLQEYLQNAENVIQNVTDKSV
ncbi:MAG: exodeoxyribonuclease VII small subunit [Candidatus Saccharimonadales bacterium]